MNKMHKKAEGSSKGTGTTIEIVGLLRRVESHLDRLRKIGWVSFKKLESIDESINLFAAQKKRELTPEEPGGSTSG